MQFRCPSDTDAGWPNRGGGVSIWPRAANRTAHQRRDFDMHLLEVLNPVARQRGVLNAVKASPRPHTLDNKTVGLLWSGTHGGDIALKRAGEMLQERFKNVKVNFYNGNNYPAPPAIVKQAGEECDVIIGATAD
jgi:hypothetical protein